MIDLNINGQSVALNAPEDMPLLWALRDIVGLTGTKFGCGIAQCGACTCLLYTSPSPRDGLLSRMPSSA